MKSVVSIHNLTKKFGKTCALDKVSLEIPQNSLFGLLGPNGAGKTTLFSLAAGFLKPNAGHIEVLGTNIRQLGKLCGKFSMLPQDARFQSNVPVIDQLIFFCRLRGMDTEMAKNAAMESLELVGLGEVAKRSPRALSHGMAKRVSLCQAFLGNPQVIFLDEPTAGLDPENARKIREVIKEAVQERTIVVSSHNLREIQEICDHACILDKGKVVEVGSIDQLTAASHVMRMEFFEPLSSAAESALHHLTIVTSIEKTSPDNINLTLNLSGTTKKEAMKTLYQTLGTHDFYPKSIFEGANLETRFLEMTGGKFDGGSGT